MARLPKTKVTRLRVMKIHLCASTQSAVESGAASSSDFCGNTQLVAARGIVQFTSRICAACRSRTSSMLAIVLASATTELTSEHCHDPNQDSVKSYSRPHWHSRPTLRHPCWPLRALRSMCMTADMPAMSVEATSGIVHQEIELSKMPSVPAPNLSKGTPGGRLSHLMSP